MKTIVNYAQKVKEQHALNKTLAPVETDLTDASRSYAIGEQFINDGDLFKAKTAIAQHDALVLGTNYEAADDITTQIKNKTVTTDPVPTEGSTNPVQSNGVFVENRNIYEVMGKNGAKNLSKPINSTTYNGITVVCDSDGVLTVTGTASASGGRLNITGDTFTLKAGTYKVVQNSDDLTKYASIVCHRKSDNTSLGYVLIENGTIKNTNAQFTLAADTECFLGMNTYQGTDYGTGAGTKEYAMVVLADDTDTTYQPYAKTNQQLTAENEALTNKLNNEIVTRSELGAKNLLPYDIQKIKALNTAGTWNGNTYTPNNSSLNITLNTDGSITVDGTSASAATATLYIYGSASEANENIFKGMIASGCPSGGATNKYSLAIQGFSTTTPSGGNNYHDIGEGITVGNDNYVRVYVRIQNNTTVSNLTFKPMIRLASDPDATYQPYAKTNQELTAENQTLTNQVSDISDEIADMNNVLGAKNLLPNKAVSKTQNGLTITVNSDGSITCNGTATAQTDIAIYRGKNPFPVEMNGKRVSLSSGNAYGTTMAGLFISLVKDGSFVTDLANTYNKSSAENRLVDFSIFDSIVCSIRFYSGKTFDNYTVYPMLRLSSISDDTYEPYSMTNREMTPYVQAISNPNLLDNPWFTVNQRGFTSDSNPSAGTHIADRWAVRYNPSSGAVAVNDGIVTLTSTGDLLIIAERFEESVAFSGKRMTTSIMLSDGTIYSGTAVFPSKNGADVPVIDIDDFMVYFQYSSYSSNYPMLGITCKANKTLAIKAVKLELGEVSTLAMDTAPNYGTELLKCQRYFVRKNAINGADGYAHFGFGQYYSATKGTYSLGVPVKMRGVPSIINNGTINIYDTTGQSNLITEFGVAYHSNESTISGDFTVSSGGTAGAMGEIKGGNDATAYIDLSADL